ncbi:hypothetical protein [Agriterribacter sp.]|uniref:hypothetical protein n=1 Tax=Agriterribacter sp. TaxID=2821509 RepID=UPI002BF05D38|nr:hypothetical protein [Agriterribacter sp.]HTN08085.1 hypothetical protein [Agriterribacter sp.]
MSSPNDNWYGHLVAQSRTDAIYDLIHMFLVPDWEPNHDLDFVTVRKQALPEQFKNIPPEDISRKLLPKDYCFPGDDYVLLHNYRLTEYLHAARWIDCIEDFEDRSFLELRYDWPQKAEEFWNNPPAYNLASKTPATTDADDERVLEEKEQSLKIAYELLQQGRNRELALQHAETGKAFLDSQQIIYNSDANTILQKISRQMMGYNIVAMVYAWNNQIDKAVAIDKLYIHQPGLWESLDTCIMSYLEMLMVKKQSDYLHYLFSDKDFRQYFLAHYEAYISLLVDDTYILSRKTDVVGIINRVNHTGKEWK